MPEQEAVIPECVKNARFRDGGYVIVEDGKIFYQTSCIHNARRENTPNRQFWKLSHLSWCPPTQIC